MNSCTLSFETFHGLSRCNSFASTPLASLGQCGSAVATAVCFVVGINFTLCVQHPPVLGYPATPIGDTQPQVGASAPLSAERWGRATDV
jgi:hypothetical protein